MSHWTNGGTKTIRSQCNNPLSRKFQFTPGYAKYSTSLNLKYYKNSPQDFFSMPSSFTQRIAEQKGMIQNCTFNSNCLSSGLQSSSTSDPGLWEAMSPFSEDPSWVFISSWAHDHVPLVTDTPGFFWVQVCSKHCFLKPASSWTKRSPTTAVSWVNLTKQRKQLPHHPQSTDQNHMALLGCWEQGNFTPWASFLAHVPPSSPFS